VIRGIPVGLVVGIVLAALAFWGYQRYTTGKVATPTLATVIDLNPALFHYPGVSSVPV
jgi:hypothetical protein